MLLKNKIDSRTSVYVPTLSFADECFVAVAAGRSTWSIANTVNAVALAECDGETYVTINFASFNADAMCVITIACADFPDLQIAPFTFSGKDRSECEAEINTALERAFVEYFVFVGSPWVVA